MKEKAFDWHAAPLHKDTLITTNFKLTQNVRRFFIEHLQSAVHFDRVFMSRMRNAVGKSLGELIGEYRSYAACKKI